MEENNLSHKKLSSSEIGNLWMTYQYKTMMKTMMNHFIATQKNEKIKEMLQTYQSEEGAFIEEVKQLFQKEEARIPVGFGESDVFLEEPRLYDEYFDLLFLRLMMKITIGLNSLHLSMSYREDIIDLYYRMDSHSNLTYKKCTTFLLEEGVLTRPPIVEMPKNVEFVESTAYMSNINYILNEKRPLNCIEVSLIYQGIESNILGMQLMRGFEQVSSKKDIKDFFKEGKELSKIIIQKYSKVLLDSDIQPPAVSWGNTTESTHAPFSEKLMMYLTSLLSNFGLTSNAIGTSFSLRSDLPTKMTLTAKDIYEYAKKGGKLMIKMGYMEQPPSTH